MLAMQKAAYSRQSASADAYALLSTRMICFCIMVEWLMSLAHKLVNVSNA